MTHVVDEKKVGVGYDLGGVDAARHRDERVGLPVNHERGAVTERNFSPRGPEAKIAASDGDAFGAIRRS